MLHSLTAHIWLRPSFRHVDFHFRTYKCDLAILNEWWQTRIAWWELLNAACQIICIRKQQHRYKAYSAGQTVSSTAQIRAEGNNTKCVGKKRLNGSVTHGLRKEHVLRPPFLSPLASSKRNYRNGCCPSVRVARIGFQMITCEWKVRLKLGVACKCILWISRSSSIMTIFRQFLLELCPFLYLKIAKYLVSRW